MTSRKYIINIFLVTTFVALLFTYGCSTTKELDAKAGAQLWGENCVRCHNAPSPSAFSDTEWETVAQHMRVRANLNSNQVDKIVKFLQMAN